MGGIDHVTDAPVGGRVWRCGESGVGERERGVWGGHQIRSSTSGQRPNNGEATVALAPEPRPTGYLPPIPFLAVFVVRAIS